MPSAGDVVWLILCCFLNLNVQPSIGSFAYTIFFLDFTASSVFISVSESHFTMAVRPSATISRLSGIPSQWGSFFYYYRCLKLEQNNLPHLMMMLCCNSQIRKMICKICRSNNLDVNTCWHPSQISHCSRTVHIIKQERSISSHVQV